MEQLIKEAGLKSVAEFYEQQTGLAANSRSLGRLIKIKNYQGQIDLPLSSLRLVQNQDRKWNERKNRSEAEQSACCIGSIGRTSGDRQLTYWWILPAVEGS